jgi:hypothetical protein
VCVRHEGDVRMDEREARKLCGLVERGVVDQ